MRERLLKLGALVGESDHGVSKSLYGHDPDGIEFEVLWTVPAEAWGKYETRRSSNPSTSTPSSPAGADAGSPRLASQT